MTTTVRSEIAAAPGGRGTSPSPRRGFPLSRAIVLAVVAVVVGLLVGRFLTYTDDPAVGLPTVVVPPDDEVRALQAAAEQQPDDPDRWLELGLAATRQAIATADPVWYGVAAEALDTAAELDPDRPLTLIAQGQLTLSLHQFDRALQLGQQATATAPRTADAWGVVVDAHVELGRYDEAAEALQTMLDLDPDISALSRASYLRQLNGDLDGAVIALRQAQAAGSGAATDNATVAVLLGEVLLHRGDLDAAQEAFAASPTPGGATGLARIAAARGDLDTAATILTDLVERTPAPPAVVALAEMQQRAGDAEGLADTVELARTIATLQQSAGQVVDLELALFEASYGDPDRAVELAEQAYEVRPDNVFAAGALAWALHKDGQTGRAVELAREAARLDTVDTAHELRMTEITGEGREALLARNPLAAALFLP